MRPIRYGDIRQILPTVADTTVTIDSPTKRHFLVTGTAAMYVLVLPDARTIRLGTPFIFENFSSEFVGVRNSDSTTWHRVPPRATLTCVLATQVTAAGTWYSMVHDPAVGNPTFGLAAFNDFNGLISTGAGTTAATWEGHALTAVNLGAASGVVSLSTITKGRQGAVRVSTGTDVNGYAQLHNGSTSIYLGGGPQAVEWSQSCSTISTAAQEYIARYGFGDNVAGGAHTRGFYLLYDRLNIDTDWQVRAINAAGTEIVDTGVAPVFGTADEWQDLRLEVNSSGSRGDAWIDRVLVTPVGGLFTRMPSNADALKRHCGITKSAGGTSYYLKLDYERVQSYPTSPR